MKCKVGTIQTVDDIYNLPFTKGILFANVIQVYGHSCHVHFIKAFTAPPTDLDLFTLEADDFNKSEIDQNFTPCTLDPGRSYVHPDTKEVCCFTTTEYYSYGGQRSRMKIQDQLKRQSGIKDIETGIPTTKPTNPAIYDQHLAYFTRLFAFYDKIQLLIAG